jgi:hypothetical protein
MKMGVFLLGLNFQVCIIRVVHNVSGETDIQIICLTPSRLSPGYLPLTAHSSISSQGCIDVASPGQGVPSFCG